jgi:hypothetical protein
MQIPKNLPQFYIKNTILIVTGKQQLIVYQAYKGKIEKIFSDEIDKVKYSDREGFFLNSGGGKTYGSGATEKDIKNIKINEFIKIFKKDVNNLLKKYKSPEIYIFSPAYIMEELEKKLLTNYQKNIIMQFEGNYCNHHPSKLLKKIDQKLTKKVEAKREENQKK